MKYLTHLIKNFNLPIRLDRYLKLLNSELTQGIIQKALRRGEVKIEGKKCSADFRVSNGVTLQIMPHLLGNTISLNNEPEETHTNNYTPGVISLSKKLIGEYLLDSNKDFIIINKPASLAIQGGSHVNISIDSALKYLNQLDNINNPNQYASDDSSIEIELIEGYWGYRITHRLDKETSGIVIIARNRDSANSITNAFKEKKVSKQYLAILNTCPKLSKGIINSLLTKDSSSRLQKSSDTGKEAITEFHVLETSADKRYSLVIFKPITGRMHQLRVHSLELGGNIVGDKKYGNDEINNNLFLHALLLNIEDDVLGYKVEAYAPLPEYFSNFISANFKKTKIDQLLKKIRSGKIY